MGIHFKRALRDVRPEVSERRRPDPGPQRGSASARQSRRQLLKWGSGLLAWTAAGWMPAMGGPASGLRPSTSRASRREAIQLVPLDQLSAQVRTRVSDILEQPSIYRRLPIQVVFCDPDLYLFLVRYPEIIVNMWQLMGVTRVDITRTGAYRFDAKDGAGTVSTVQLVYGTPRTHVFLAEGHYEGPLAPRRITGGCVLLLTSSYGKRQDARTRITNRLDVFVQLDNAGVEVLAKTLHPLLGRTADSNFGQSTQFLSQLARVVETNGPGIKRLCTRLNNVEPAVRDRFAELAARINQRAVVRGLINADDEVAATRLSDRPGEQNSSGLSDSVR